jgi:hypothetical protein
LNIDDPDKTDILVRRLKATLPIEANVTPRLVDTLSKKSPDVPVPTKCNVVDVMYSGDELGGIMCSLDVGGPEATEVHLVSITHLSFYRRIPLSREIENYQRHRTKKLRQQAARGY